jgi:hypothetical protein
MTPKTQWLLFGAVLGVALAGTWALHRYAGLGTPPPAKLGGPTVINPGASRGIPSDNPTPVTPVTPPSPGQAVLPFGNTAGGNAGQASLPNFGASGSGGAIEATAGPRVGEGVSCGRLDDARRLDRRRWSVPLWTPADHESWKQAMALAWQGHLQMD